MRIFGRRGGKTNAARLWLEGKRLAGEHVHALYPDHTECVNGECPECPKEGCRKLEGHGGRIHE